MALTPSTMKLAPGDAAPSFSLPDPYGVMHSLSEFAGRKALLVAFLCNHCPYVKHIAPEFAKLAKEYEGKGVGVVAINSNDFTAHPDDSPTMMKAEIGQRGYTFSYLVDETQVAAKAYHAACTPDFFLFDKDQKLVYRGQMDGSRPGNNQPVTGEISAPRSTPSSPNGPYRQSSGLRWAAISSGKPGNEPK